MQPLNTGESPVLSCRIPTDLHAAVMAAAGTGRGDLSRWLRDLLEREFAKTGSTREERQ